MTTRLRRSVLTRVMGGAWFQWLLTLQLAFLAWALVAAPGLEAGQLGPLILLFVPYAVLWTSGVTAWAEVDDTGLRWRYFVRVQLTWAQVTGIELTSRSTPGVIGPSQRLIRIRTAQGPARLIAPALSGGQRDTAEFALAVVAAARQHGVPVEGAGGPRWRDVPAIAA